MRSNRGWLWYFLAVVLLSAVAVIVLIVYNVGQQLRLEDVQAARRLWQEHGLRDYRLVFTLKTNNATPDQYVVHVRGGRPEFAACNGKPVPADERGQFTMDGLLDRLERHVRDRDRPDE